MKRNLLGLFAVVAAVALSSFSVKFGTIHYLVYNGGTQSDFSNYSQQTTQPAEDLGTNSLYWISVEDINSVGGIQQAEFNPAFDILDSDNDNNLNDEIEKTTSYSLSPFGSDQTQLEKKF